MTCKQGFAAKRFGTTFVLMVLSARSLAGVCERSRGVVQSLENYTFKSCDLIEAADLSALDRFELHGTGDLIPEDFEGLTNVTSLVLNNLYSYEIPARAFHLVPNLKKLRIFQSALRRIDSEAFAGLDQLEEFQLEGHFLKEISADTFSTARDLRTLEISDERIYTQLSLYPFQNLRKLESLTIDFYDIPTSAFDGLETLKYLKLRTNKLKLGALDSIPTLKGLEVDAPTVEPGVFRGLDSLFGLKITTDKIPDNLLADQTSVEILTLIAENADRVPGNLFLDQFSLKELTLYIGHAVFEDLAVFKNLLGLSLFYLRHELSDIDVGLFAKENFPASTEIWIQEGTLSQKSRHALELALGDRVRFFDPYLPVQ